MVRRQSELFLPTLRDDPADAEAISHKLLVRAGMIRQVSAGLWSFLPAGWKTHEKIVQVIREEMDGIGGAGDADAGARARRAVGEDRPHPHPRAVQAAGPRRPRLRPLDDARGDGDVPLLGARLLPRPAEVALPLPDEGPRRAAPPGWAPAGAGVHHEGLLLVRPGRGRPGRQLPEAQGRVRPHLRALRDRGGRGAGRVGDDGRQRVDRLPGAVGCRREHARHLRERRLCRRSRDRARRAAGTGVPGVARQAARGRNARYHHDRGARRLPRHRPCRDVEGDAGDEGRRNASCSA